MSTTTGRRATWRAINLHPLKYRVEQAPIRGYWVAYRGDDFQLFPTWREAIAYALDRVAALMQEATA